MDIKWKRFSYSVPAKIIAFLLVIICYSSLLTMFVTGMQPNHFNFDMVSEDSYFLSADFINESSGIIQNIGAVTDEYKNEEHILNGGSITEYDISKLEDKLYAEFESSSRNYNPNLSAEENYEVFRVVYKDRIVQANDELIQEDLKNYRETLQKLSAYDGLVYYYAKKGETEFANSSNHNKGYFTSAPAYMIFEGYEQEIFPQDIRNNHLFPPLIGTTVRQLAADDVICIAFTDEFLDPRLAAWNEKKTLALNSLYGLVGLGLVLALAFLYLLFTIGRRPEDEKIHLNASVDKIYNDINMVMCLGLIGSWIACVTMFYRTQIYEVIFAVTMIIAAAGLILVLSLVKHIKNRTFFTYSLTYKIFYHVFAFVKKVFNSGSTAVKVVLIVIVYPILAGLGFFMLPITIAVAAWLALKKVEEFNAIKEGVKQVKEGNFRHTINVPGEGELAVLAADINSITDGLSKAVDNEIKSERLKSELITNVSHDIRTPLTSIITYVDLLKNEQDPEKIAEYVEVLDQKAQRLKTLTDDLFEATKASSGNIPVNYEKIDLVSLLTQGLGEFDDKIRERQLEFKLGQPADKVFVRADGKLLWRAIENLLLNVCKYALEGSRVYIDISDAGADAVLTIKNISAYELNISAEELMERFKRGDAARSSQGSGLGLSIAKSLVEIQKGIFTVEIDGDLFKAVIHMPKEI